MQRQPYNQQKQKPESKININQKIESEAKQLRILDYRNGKYQGNTSQNSRLNDGLGILIDDNYSFVLCQWKQNFIEGPFFMVYPDQSILYGFIQNKSIGQFVCFQVSKQFNMILSKDSNILLLDLLPSNSILVLKFDKQFLNEHNVSSILSRKNQHQVNQQISNGIQLLSQENYTNQQQKYKIYQQKLNITNMPQYLKTYDTFIREKFKSKTNNMDLIQMIKTRQDFTISFKNCTITLFIKLYLQTNQTKMIGSLNTYQNKYQYYRKMLHSSIQQFVSKSKNSFQVQYKRHPNLRPKNCSIQLSNLHRSSITYINKFINLTYMYQIKENLEKINQLIKIFVTNKLAQVQLQNSRYYPNQNTQAQQTLPVNYSLNEVKEEIYNAIQRKQQIAGKKIYPVISRMIQQPFYPNKSNEIQAKILTKNSQNITKNNSPYKIILQQNDNGFYQSHFNRSKTFTNLLSPIVNSYETREIKENPTKNKLSNQQKTSGKKFVYYQADQQAYEQTKYKISNQPIDMQPYQYAKKLTEDYQAITKSRHLLEHQNLPTRSPYRLDNAIYKKKVKSSRDFEPQNISPRKNLPLTQKKVFKYLPD